MRKDGTFHLSDFASWRGCDFRYALEVIDGEPPKFRHPATLNGTAIHRLIDWLHLEGGAAGVPICEFTSDVMAERYAKEFKEAIDNPMRPEERDVPISWGEFMDLPHALSSYAADALQMLGGYKDDPRNHDANIVGLHEKWEATIGGAPWSGEYDQLRREADGTLSLIDFKSGVEKPAPAPLLLWEQVGYAIPVWEALGELPARIYRVQLRDYIPYLRGGKTKAGRIYKAGEMRGPAFYEIPINRGMLKSLEDEMAMFVKMVGERQFPRRPSNYQCSRCRVQDACLKSYGADWTAAGMNPSAGDYDNGEG